MLNQENGVGNGSLRPLFYERELERPYVVVGRLA